MWDSRDRAQHYVKKERPAREQLVPGARNIINKPLVEREKILIPPLHMRLGFNETVHACSGQGWEVLNDFSVSIAFIWYSVNK